MKHTKRQRSRTTQLLTMDELHARPCEVDGRPALFHRWIEEDDMVLKVPLYWALPRIDEVRHNFKRDKFIPKECDLVVAHHTFALVEYHNGTIAKVDPELIQFTGKEGQA